ncbi:MAG: hypothetical protein Tsb0014_15230 [Pleurocapsa sp.]
MSEQNPIKINSLVENDQMTELTPQELEEIHGGLNSRFHQISISIPDPFPYGIPVEPFYRFKQPQVDNLRNLY